MLFYDYFIESEQHILVVCAKMPRNMSSCFVPDTSAAMMARNLMNSRWFNFAKTKPDRFEGAPVAQGSRKGSN